LVLRGEIGKKIRNGRVKNKEIMVRRKKRNKGYNGVR
jgi:hypothetical protein